MLGYAAFSARYAAELRMYGGDANKLYRYEERYLPFKGETLEGQAQIMGDLAAASRRHTARTRSGSGCCAPSCAAQAFMASRLSALILILPALLLIACAQQEPQVIVAKHGSAIDIVVTRPGAEASLCIKSVTVTRDGTDIAETPPLWELSTAQPNRCASTFRYGQAPTGYAQAGAAPVLAAGTTYLVEVSGPGLLGGATFTVKGEDGLLTSSAPN